MSARPTFIHSKGERNRDTGVETDDLIERYVTAFVSRFKWQGLPEGCPEDFIERQLFYFGGVSAKKVRGLGNVVMASSPTALSLYNTPLGWMPNGIYGSEANDSISKEIWKESKNPVLWDGVPMCDRIAPYLEIQRKAMNALSVNLIGLTNPVVIETVPGAELKGKIIKNNLGAGDVYLPVIDKGTIGASVLDLKATDHTANLLGVIHDADGEILDMMHIKSSLEKASGISVEEASASDQQVSQGLMMDLRKREKWCEMINAKLGTEFSVTLADEYLTEVDQYASGGYRESEDKSDPGSDKGSEIGDSS